MDSSQAMRSRGRFQFRIQGILLMIGLCAVALGWWRDRRQLSAEIALRDLEIARSQGMLEALRQDRDIIRQSRSYGARAGYGYAMGYAANNPQALGRPTPDEFIALLRNADEPRFELAANSFARTSAADKAVPALVELTSDPDPNVKKRAALTLAKMASAWKSRDDIDPNRPRTLTPALIDLMEHHDGEVR